MKRSPLVVLVALLTLAGCGSAESTAAAPVSSLPTATTAAAVPTPAAPGAAAPGIPPLSGTPTNLKAQSSAQAGTGTPPAGLTTQDVVVGQGTAAKAGDTVSVRYSGTLYDGTPFDASWKQGDTPATFPLDQVVPGFAQGIEGMAPGGRRVMVIPPALGYGAETNGPIPGGSTLVFVVDLVSVS